MTRVDTSTPKAGYADSRDDATRQPPPSRRLGRPPVTVAPTRDVVTRGGAPLQAGTASLTSPLAAGAQAGASPFAFLPLGTAPRLPTLPALGAPAGRDADLAPTAEVLGALAGFESAALAGGAGAGDVVTGPGLRVRTGLLLGLYEQSDAQGGGADATPELVTQTAQALETTDLGSARLKVATTLTQGSGQFPAGMDVNAFVQAVLRESYLLQCEVMKDYAEKVKYYNDLKKQIRARLTAARQLGAGGALSPELASILDWKHFDAESGDWVDYLPADAVGGIEGGAESAGGADGADEDPESAASESGDAPATGTATGALGGVDPHTDVPDDLKAEFIEPRRARTAAYLGPIADRLLAMISDGDGQWYERFATVLTPEMSRFDELTQTLSREVRYLTPAQFGALMNVAVQAYAQYAEKVDDGENEGGQKWNAGAMVQLLLGSCTDEQLEGWHVGATGGLRNALDDALRSQADWVQPESVSQRLADYRSISEALPADFDAEDLAPLASLYAQVKREGAGIALDTLTEKMHALPADTARELLEFAATDLGDADAYSKLFFACSPDTLFTPPDLDRWSFLEKAGGEAADFYARWKEAATADGAEAEPTTGALEGTGDGAGAADTGETTDAASLSDPAPREGADEPPAGDLGDGTVSKEYLDGYIKSLEEELNGVGDDAQLANLDLQNALQTQQQLMQMMSNISKMLHETALAIIRKVGG